MKKKNIFLWFLLLIFLTTYNSNLENDIVNSFFRLQKIEIDGTKNANSDEIEERLEIFKKKNLILIDQSEMIKNIADLDYVKDIELKKIYPDKIKIKIHEHKPIGIFIKNENKYVLSDSGKLIKDNSEKFRSLPLLYGENAHENFSMFYQVLINLNFNTNTVDNFKYFKSNRWDIFLKNGKLLRLPSDSKRIEASIKRFLSINEKEKFKRFKVFDFRVKNQLIMK